MPKETVGLFSIEAVGFGVKDILSGSIDGIGLNYMPSSNCLSFFIRSITYEAQTKGNKINSPTIKRFDLKFESNEAGAQPKAAWINTAIYIPDLGPDKNYKRRMLEYLKEENIIGFAVNVAFNSDTHHLEQCVAIIDWMIGVTVSMEDITELLNVINVISCSYTDENSRVMEELSLLSIENELFNKIDQLIWEDRSFAIQQKLARIESERGQKDANLGKQDSNQPDASASSKPPLIMLRSKGVHVTLVKDQKV